MSEAKSGDLGRNDGADSKDGKSGSSAKGRRKSRKSSSDLGRALKTVYDNTLAEDVPSDFMDLLGKLD